MFSENLLILSFTQAEVKMIQLLRVRNNSVKEVGDSWRWIPSVLKGPQEVVFSAFSDLVNQILVKNLISFYNPSKE